MKRDRQGAPKQQPSQRSPSAHPSTPPSHSSSSASKAPAVNVSPAGQGSNAASHAALDEPQGSLPSSPPSPRNLGNRESHSLSPRRNLSRSATNNSPIPGRSEARESPRRSKGGASQSETGDLGLMMSSTTEAPTLATSVPVHITPAEQTSGETNVSSIDGDISSSSSHGDVSDGGSQPFTLTSTISRGTYHQCGSARRVKVYELKGETWQARGTGYCAGVYDEQLDEALLVARMEEKCHMMSGVTLTPEESATVTSNAAANPDGTVHYVVVVSETLDTDDVMLKSKVVREDVYQRQQDTLVVWTEPDGVDLALSFQEAEGCHEVWEFLTEVQKHFMISENPLSESPPTTPNPHSPLDGMGGLSSSALDSEALGLGGDNMFALPQPQFSNLDLVELHLKEIASRSPAARERVAEWLLKEEYIKKLIPIFNDAEDLEALSSLHSLCSIMQTILLLNDNVIFEYILLDDVFLGVVGMLEYDPEFPRLKANYRAYLSDSSRFRQVVPIDDQGILAKIHQTYRLLYLKDVILARVLDDPTFSILNSFVFFHQVDIVNYFTTNEQFLTRLFRIFDPNAIEPEERMHEAVIFLQQLCAMGKQVQLPARVQLYRTLVEWGLLTVVEYALARPDDRLRNAASEIFMTIIEYDADSVRNHVMNQVEQKKRPLVTMLADLLHSEADLGLKTQLAEAMRVIFDIGPDGLGGPATTTAQALAAATGQQRSASDPDKFLTWFYEGDVEHLFGPLNDLPSFHELEKSGRYLDDFTRPRSALYGHLCELLCYLMANHTFRSHYFVLTSELSLRVASLLYSREKHIRLASLRFFRTCVAGNNQFTLRHFIKVDLFGAILSLLEREARRDNLVTSACLDFFESMRRENLKQVLTHLVERHGSQVRALAENPLAGKTFGGILALTQKNGEPAFASQTMAVTQAEQAEEKARIARDLGRRGISMSDADEDKYFNEDDEDDVDKALGASVGAGETGPPSNGPSPALGALASISQYGDDDDLDRAVGTSAAVAVPSSSMATLPATSDSSPQLPRLSEKRRREKVDDDDEGDLADRIAKRKGRSANADSDAEDERLGAGGFIRVPGSTSSAGPTAFAVKTGDKMTASGSTGHTTSGAESPGVQKISINLSSSAKRMAVTGGSSDAAGTDENKVVPSS